MYIQVPRQQKRTHGDFSVAVTPDHNGINFRQEFAARIFAESAAIQNLPGGMEIGYVARYAVYAADVLISALNMDPAEIHAEFNPQQKDQ